MNSYFISNDDVACKPIYTTLELDHDSWPIVVTAPSADLKSPKYDWKTHAWVENAAESQGQRITALEDVQKSLDESVQKLTQDHSAAVQTSNQLSTKLDGLQQLVVQSNANTAKIMSTLNSMNNKKEGNA
jgi:hypothetical protein